MDCNLSFARCLFNEMEDFAKTDKTHPDEFEEKFNLMKWDGGTLGGGGGHLGVVTSLIVGYIKLNLLLTDYKKFEKIVSSEDWAIQNCRGNNDGGHPDWMANQINKLVDFPKDSDFWTDSFSIKTVFKHLDSTTTSILSEYLKMIFKTLYLHLKSKQKDRHGCGTIDVDRILSDIRWGFSLSYSIMGEK